MFVRPNWSINIKNRKNSINYAIAIFAKIVNLFIRVLAVIHWVLKIDKFILNKKIKVYLKK